MKYYVQVWIPVDADDIEFYDSEAEAEKIIESLSLMQPENRYEVVCEDWIDEDDDGSDDDDDDDDDESWKREIAMEAGMLHGVGAYNEAMGWEIQDPECINCGGHGCEACDYA